MTTFTNETVSSVSITLIVTGAPAVDSPSIGDEMSEGAVITQSNQYEYTTRYERTEDDCELVNVDASFVSLTAKTDGTGTLSIIKTFDEDVSLDAAKDWINGLSTILILDNINHKVIELQKLKVVDYECV